MSVQCLRECCQPTRWGEPTLVKKAQGKRGSRGLPVVVCSCVPDAATDVTDDGEVARLTQQLGLHHVRVSPTTGENIEAAVSAALTASPPRDESLAELLGPVGGADTTRTGAKKKCILL